jgi:hypothetical protein
VSWLLAQRSRVLRNQLLGGRSGCRAECGCGRCGAVKEFDLWAKTGLFVRADQIAFVMLRTPTVLIMRFQVDMLGHNAPVYLVMAPVAPFEDGHISSRVRLGHIPLNNTHPGVLNRLIKNSHDSSPMPLAATQVVSTPWAGKCPLDVPGIRLELAAIDAGRRQFSFHRGELGAEALPYRQGGQEIQVMSLRRALTTSFSIVMSSNALIGDLVERRIALFSEDPVHFLYRVTAGV